MQPGKKHPHGPGKQERKYQQRKHLLQYHDEFREEGGTGMSRHKRKEQRDDDCSNEIAQYGIGGKRCLVPSQFPCYDGSSCGRRAYKAHHCPLSNIGMAEIRKEMQRYGYCGTRHNLYRRQPKMPSAYLHFLRVHLAECEEQHHEQKQGDKMVSKHRRRRLQRIQK